MQTKRRKWSKHKEWVKKREREREREKEKEREIREIEKETKQKASIDREVGRAAHDAPNRMRSQVCALCSCQCIPAHALSL